MNNGSDLLSTRSGWGPVAPVAPKGPKYTIKLA